MRMHALFDSAHSLTEENGGLGGEEDSSGLLAQLQHNYLPEQASSLMEMAPTDIQGALMKVGWQCRSKSINLMFY